MMGEMSVRWLVVCWLVVARGPSAVKHVTGWLLYENTRGPSLRWLVVARKSMRFFPTLVGSCTKNHVTHKARASDDDDDLLEGELWRKKVCGFCGFFLWFGEITQ